MRYINRIKIFKYKINDYYKQDVMSHLVYLVGLLYDHGNKMFINNIINLGIYDLDVVQIFPDLIHACNGNQIDIIMTISNASEEKYEPHFIFKNKQQSQKKKQLCNENFMVWCNVLQERRCT